MFTESIPAETKEDFEKPITKPDETRPYWVLSDSKGKLKGLLHVFRRSCYCKDVIVIVTDKTSTDYVNYLNERNYNTITAGQGRIDFHTALDRLAMYYNVRTVLVDSGGGLSSTLLKEGLADELSILISPFIVGKAATNLFRSLEQKVNLELIRTERIKGSHMHVLYRVLSNINTLTPVHADQEAQR